LPRRARRSR